jgi:thioredoxin reductase (NADPH)
MEIKNIQTETQFKNELKEQKLFVADFFSTDCPPCEKLAPIFDRLAERYSNIQFVRIFRQEFKPLAEVYGVSGSPTVLFFKQGQLLDKRLSGEIRESEFISLLDELSGEKKEAVVSEKIEEKDLCIIGTGPAGLTAAVYAARYKIDQILIGDLAGGLMTSSHKICNYPSETEISGFELTRKMQKHVEDLQIPSVTGTVEKIEREANFFKIILTSGETVKAKNILLATGTKHRHLGVEKEAEFVGKGVSYCATCDGMFFAGKNVAVVGGSDSANTAALFLAKVAKKVYQIYRGSALRGETAWVEQVQANDKIEIIFNAEVKEIKGERKVEAIVVDSDQQKGQLLPVDGVFVEVGSEPDATLINQLQLQTDQAGYIKTSQDQKTSVAGVWAAGDITTNSNSFRQIITACSEGAIAAQTIFSELQKNPKRK